MTKEQLIEILNKLPEGTPIRIQSGEYRDDGYDVKMRVFTYNNQLEAYICPDHSTRNHYNFPENYSGVAEITNRVLGTYNVS